MRDEFSKDVRRIIGARAGWRCANPRCRTLTEGPHSDAAKSVSVGIAAHITAASPGGPRFDPKISAEERAGPENGVWLCGTCARQVDVDEQRYLTGILRMWKADTEELVIREVGRQVEPSADVQPIRYSAVGLWPECLWWRAHRLHKVMLDGGLRPDFGFHEVPPNAWEGVGKSPERNPVEPVLDVTVINDGSRVGTANAVGLELVASWTVMKGLPVAQKLPITDVYVLRLERMNAGETQMASFKDPVALPAGGGLFRFQLWLENFAVAVQNEALVRLALEFEGRLHRSGIIYLGRY